MDTLQLALGLSFLLTAWFVPIGSIRMIAYVSGQVDHTPGMRNLAIATLATGALAAITMLVLTFVVLAR